MPARGIAPLATLATSVAALLLFAPSATAAPDPDLASLSASCVHRDAGSGSVHLPYVFCDDGVPSGAGGSKPNTALPGARHAVQVPAAYKGYTGLPAADLAAGAQVPGSSAGKVALDVDVSMPDPARYAPPPSGYPLVVMMHGCCAGDKTGWEASSVDAGGEKWHYSNAWFASRGYVVLTYTARGFVNSNGDGSTGETQLDSRRFEINDYQYLAGLLADDPAFHVDPQRVVTTGGSYGGGFSWLTLTDPTWKSPGGKSMRLAATAPKYGWTDLVYSLVPTGMHRHDALPTTDPAAAGKVIGMPKASIDAALYASGKTGVPPGSAHTTFNPEIDQSFTCLQSGDPFETNPLCTTTLSKTLPEFYSDRSAYYQNAWFSRIKSDPTARVPLFSAGTWTDPLFTTIEHLRMAERMLKTVPSYPVQQYYGDYQHFVQNKDKEWGDVCGSDHHVCRLSDYPGGDLNATPTGDVATGITTMLNRFIDHYVGPQGDPAAPAPPHNVTASLQICPQNASPQHPLDEPGPRFTAATFGALAPHVLTIDAKGQQATTYQAPSDHAVDSDPVKNQVQNSKHCPVEQTPTGAGIAAYTSDPLKSTYTMLGLTRVTVPHTGQGQDIQLNARMYDVFPDGTEVMVDRGERRVTNANETTLFELHGNGWQFPKGHSIRIELTQDDDPYLKRSNAPSSLLLSGAKLEIPVREGPARRIGHATGSSPLAVRVIAPRLASDAGSGRRFPVRVLGSVAADHFQLYVRTEGKRGWRLLASRLHAAPRRFKGKFGTSYEFRARAIGASGKAGPWAHARTIVPIDDHPRRHGGPTYTGSWRHPQVKHAWYGGLSRAEAKGSSMTVIVHGSELFLVGRVSPAGGRALVVYGPKRKKVSFHSARTRNRVVVAHFRRTRVCAAGKPRRCRNVRRTDRAKLRVKSLGGGRVEIDAIGFR